MAHDILVVDDERDIRLLISGILGDEGHHTREAGDADQALTLLRTRQPNLVILDVWLQGSRMDGLELLDEIKRDRSEEHTSELQSLMRISYAVFCLKKKTQ